MILLDLTNFEEYALSLKFQEDAELWGQLLNCVNDAQAIKLAEKHFKFTGKQEDDFLLTFNSTKVA